jgi:hypothetical protein
MAVRKVMADSKEITTNKISVMTSTTPRWGCFWVGAGLDLSGSCRDMRTA